MRIHPVQAGLIGLAAVVIFSVIARLTFLEGSLFDPAVAPGLGPLALGDLLAVAAFAAGFFVSALSRQSR
jgi:hypothetical protein